MSAWEEALKQQQGESSSEAESEEEVSEEIPEELKEEQERFELLKDIPLEITVEIGSASLPLEEILRLHPNSIVELDRYVNEPVDIKINGRLVAKGKLYTVKENFGIKITQIITPEERLKLLEE
ncbi:flagellar motor switch protein FliN/FliY [Desulfurobacterium pacificum]|uniref:Flagellar motor switch protein FliN n=2 Tax=Desulfurobacterium pacificum TaxID=240166 RepID=A0ABY1NMI8_9BACT|nr:flagellar motor switch protein FliN/FliY [Desulfurobacterium pacificum]